MNCLFKGFGNMIQAQVAFIHRLGVSVKILTALNYLLGIEN